MFDLAQQTQFNRSCSDASFGYAKTILAMYAEASNGALAFWADVANATSEPAGPRSTRADVWYEPSRASRSAYRPVSSVSADSNPMTAWFAAFAPPSPADTGSAAFMNPMLAFWNMMPMSATPAAWPMAYGMIASGVPRSVAWPAAEANTAAMDAMSTAATAMGAPFSSYHSAGGFASAQVFSPAGVMGMMGALPVGFAAMFPWLAHTTA
jgi:hypothetical protein